MSLTEVKEKETHVGGKATVVEPMTLGGRINPDHIDGLMKKSTTSGDWTLQRREGRENCR